MKTIYTKKFGWMDVLMIILFLLAVYFILTRIFGSSATELTIMISLFIILAVALYNLNREIGEIKIKMINRFDKVREDISKLNDRLKE